MTAPVLVAVALAGACGAVARLLLARALTGFGGELPLATAVVNVLGCFLFGLAVAAWGARWSPAVQAAVLTGFLGAFTTFSTFAFEAVELAVAGRWLVACVHVAVHNALGLAALVAGRYLGRLLA
ncbi:MAG: CrcB family protein [Planctomycetes bacterium]|nr:CrcB family protein [Planctomycetota bacterium]